MISNLVEPTPGTASGLAVAGPASRCRRATVRISIGPSGQGVARACAQQLKLSVLVGPSWALISRQRWLSFCERSATLVPRRRPAAGKRSHGNVCHKNLGEPLPDTQATAPVITGERSANASGIRDVILRRRAGRLEVPQLCAATRPSAGRSALRSLGA